MANLTFMDMVKAAQDAIEGVSPEQAQAAVAQDDSTLIIDVRDAADIAGTGIIPGAAAISLGTLGYKADTTMPEDYQHPELGDHARPIIVTCALGAMASLGAKQLRDMGYNNVTYMQGGTVAWKEADLPVADFSGGA